MVSSEKKHNAIQPLTETFTVVSQNKNPEAIATFATPMEALEYLDSVYVSQKPNYYDSCGCDYENKYRVYDGRRKDYYERRDKREKLFKAREHSTCAQRSCQTGDMQGLSMSVEFRMWTQGGECKWLPFLRVEKEYSCCFSKPLVRVTLEEQMIGHIVSECGCSFRFSIYEAESQVAAYVMRAGCCECGMLCNMPCGYCEVADIEILDGKGSQVGKVRKIWGGCDKPGYSDPDYYAINFPKNSTPKHKALLLSCALFLYYRYFEEKIPQVKRK
eukprot:TRINITY_DN1953_c0_g2_i1.p1 TRINITY_DN1953_c0_g2~~TRINITY_DN1953_c0_g2_i1.p1  ORF type:complete len:273 (+),score=69.37 TRINITY_DN1953_c0_g2_i1:71-889(+)